MSTVNKELINKYKNDKIIIKTYYTDSQGVNIDGIVNPLKVDNRQIVAPTDNQGNYPSCAGYSACTIAETIYWKHTGKLIQLESNQVYAKAKQLDGMVNADGTYLEAALKAALELCDLECLKNAKINTLANKGDLKTIESVKHLIHKYDIVQAGFAIDESWWYVNNKDYILKSGGKSLGGHAVCLVGYDNIGFYVQNQWGPKWGSKGFAIIPYDVFLKELMYCAYISDVKY